MHVVLVRRHGVVPPIGVDTAGHSRPSPGRCPDQCGATAIERCSPRSRPSPPPPRPLPTRTPSRPGRYDLVKEFVVALLVVALTVALAAVFLLARRDSRSPWPTGPPAAPNDVVATAAGELAGTTTSATYGPPYNNAADGQTLGPLQLQKWGGVRIPVDPANDFVLAPLRGDRRPRRSRARWPTGDSAAADQQAAWAAAYADALDQAAPDNDPAKVAAGRLRSGAGADRRRFLDLARSGGLEGDLTSAGSFYGTDHTRPCCCWPTAPTWRTRPAPSTSAATSGG